MSRTVINRNRIFQLLGICLLLFTVLPADAIENQRYWITFTDRGEFESLTQEEIRALAFEHGLTEASLERRRIEGVPEENLITLSDLPVAPEYVQTLSEFGIYPVHESRWFNCVSVECDPEFIPLLTSLPFVVDITLVMQMMVTGCEYEVAGSWDGYPAPGPGAVGAGLYGPSYLQNLQVNAVEAHRQGITGRGVLMVVLDSGFELSHEAYTQLDLFAEYDFVADDDYTGCEPGERRGQPNHGTGCLSVIAGYSPGNLIGLAHEATFILAKTEDTSREVIREEDNWVAAIEWAERLGARVLSSSLSYKDWYELYEYDGVTSIASRAGNRAQELGMVCATSTGNEGPQPMTLGAPCEAYGVLGIGAVDSTGAIARFSSRGPTADGRIKPDLVAMGVQTACIEPQSEHGYSRWNGTSLSTPVMGGVIALVRCAHPEWSAQETIQALRSTASRADRPDNTYGWGIPDVMAATRWPEGRFRFVDQDGDGVEGIRVWLESTGSNDEEDVRITIPVTTDATGYASIPNVPEGTWQVQFELASDAPYLVGEFERSPMYFPDGHSRTCYLLPVQD